MSARQLTREENLKILKALYGDKFDYSKTEFKTSRDNITYWCNVHECYVTQNLGKHRNGQQCPQCAQEERNRKNSKSFEYFLSQAIKTFGNRFKYDKSSFKNMVTPMKIYCFKHGWFEQTPAAHLRYAYGCPKCAKEASYGPKENLRSLKSDVLNRLSLTHPEFNEFDFSELPDRIRLDNKYLVKHIPCNNEFFIRISTMFNNGHGGNSGCPICSRLKKYKLSDGTIDVIQCAKDILGDNYSFEKTIFQGMKISWIITCKDHGDFECLPQNTLRGHGCPCCAIQKVSEQKRMPFEEFVTRAEERHGKDTFTYYRDTYTGSADLMAMQCNICGDKFSQRPNNHLQGQGCPNCARGKQVSKWELEIREFLTANNIDIITNDRTLIAPKEIDIYLPQYKLGIECHGIYYHTDKFGWGKRDHLNKLESAENAGIKLIQLFEDEWKDNKEICKSIILNLIGKSHYYFGARECEIKSVPYSEAKDFLNRNHIQGATNSSYNYGLYYTLNGKEYLVSLMTFGSDRFGNGNKLGEYELIRFCNKLNYNIPGGASKLFKYFIKNHNPSVIKSFCNRRLYTGNMYLQLGMELERTSIPNYFYVSSTERLSRQKFQKLKLINMGCPKEMSEQDYCKYYLGLYRIYDCGNFVFYWRKQNNS